MLMACYVFGNSLRVYKCVVTIIHSLLVHKLHITGLIFTNRLQINSSLVFMLSLL